MGEEFDLAILREVSSSRDETRLLELIRKATEIGIVRKKRAGRGRFLYSFDDEVTMDVLVENLSSKSLVEQHRNIGLVMEKTYGDEIDEHAAESGVALSEGKRMAKVLSVFFKGRRCRQFQRSS